MGELVVLIPLAGMATGSLVLVGVYKLVVRLLDRRQAPPLGGDERRELEELRNEVAILSGLTDRVAELEERVDFAERMLARREPPILPEGDARNA